MIRTGLRSSDDSPISIAAILSLALPSSAVFLITTLVAVLMIRLAANLGADAVAAVSAGTRLYNVFFAFATGINVGALALIANTWGADQREEAEQYLAVSLLIALLLGTVITLLTWIGADWLIARFDLDPGAHTSAVSYICWLALFYPLIATSLVFGSGLRAAGDARTPMVIAVLANLASALLAWRWSTHPPFGHAPHVRFIALGMGLGNVVGFLLMLAWWRSGRLRLALVRPDRHYHQRLRALWHIGYPAAIEQGLLQIGLIAFLWVVAHYGTAAFAAYGASVSLMSLAMVVGFGFSIAVSVLVAQQLGAGSPDNARRVARRALAATIILLGAPGLLLAWYAHPAALWLTGDAAIADNMVPIIYAFTVTLPLLAVEFCLGGALRGAGDTRFPVLNVLAGLVVVRFGLALLLWQLDFAVEWIYATLIADYAVKSILLVQRFRSRRWIRLSRTSPTA